MGNYIRLLNQSTSGSIRVVDAADRTRGNRMNKHLQDNVVPSVISIREKFVNGQFGHDVESTVIALLNKIDELEARNSFLSRQLDHYMTRTYDH